MIKSLVLIPMTATIFTLLCGCSDSAPTASISPTVTAVSPRQRAAMKDGTVTWDEYKAGFDAYQACLAKAGYQLVDPHIDKYQLMESGVPDAAVKSGTDGKCYRYHWEELDGAWQIDHEDTSESGEIIKACLTFNGVTPAEKYEDNMRLMQKHHIDVTQCPSDG